MPFSAANMVLEIIRAVEVSPSQPGLRLTATGHASAGENGLCRFAFASSSTQLIYDKLREIFMRVRAQILGFLRKTLRILVQTSSTWLRVDSPVTKVAA